MILIIESVSVVPRNELCKHVEKPIAPQMPEIVLPTINLLAVLEMRLEFLAALHS